jgi:hypothetical protein
MLQYGLAEDTMRSGRPDVSANELYSQSAIYVAAAHALKPNYSVLVSAFFSDNCTLSPFLFVKNIRINSVLFSSNAGVSQCFAIGSHDGMTQLIYFLTLLFAGCYLMIGTTSVLYELLQICLNMHVSRR